MNVERQSIPEVSLIETMRLDEGRIVRRDRHLARARTSADALGLQWKQAPVDAALDEAIGTRPGGVWRCACWCRPAAIRGGVRRVHARPRPRVARGRGGGTGVVGRPVPAPQDDAPGDLQPRPRRTPRRRRRAARERARRRSPSPRSPTSSPRSTACASRRRPRAGCCPGCSAARCSTPARSRSAWSPESTSCPRSGSG